MCQQEEHAIMHVLCIHLADDRLLAGRRQDGAGSLSRHWASDRWGRLGAPLSLSTPMNNESTPVLAEDMPMGHLVDQSLG